MLICFFRRKTGDTIGATRVNGFWVLLGDGAVGDVFFTACIVGLWDF